MNWGVSAPLPHRRWLQRAVETQHAVVAAYDDVTVVQQVGIGYSSKPRQSFGVAGHQGSPPGLAGGDQCQRFPTAGRYRARCGPPDALRLRGTAGNESAYSAASRPARPIRRTPDRRASQPECLRNKTTGRSAEVSNSIAAACRFRRKSARFRDSPTTRQTVFPRALRCRRRATASARLASQTR